MSLDTIFTFQRAASLIMAILTFSVCKCLLDCWQQTFLVLIQRVADAVRLKRDFFGTWQVQVKQCT